MADRMGWEPTAPRWIAIGWLLITACSETPAGGLLQPGSDAGVGIDRPTDPDGGGSPDGGDDDGGIAPEVNVAFVPNDRLDFGTVLVNASVTRTLVIENIGPVNATVEPGLGSDVPDCSRDATFCIESPTLPLSLPPGVSTDVILRYQPRTARPEDSAVLAFTFCAGEDCDQSIQLAGRAVTDPIVCTPDQFDFGYRRPGECAQQGFDCELITQNPVGATRARIGLDENDADPAFTLTENPLPQFLSTGNVFGLISEFCGDVGDEDRATEVVVDLDTAIGARELIIPLSGQTSGPVADIDPLTVDFGPCTTAAPCREVIAVHSIGSREVVLTATTAAAGALELSVDVTTATVAPGETLTLTLTAQPLAASNEIGFLNLTTNDVTQPDVSIPVTVDGIDRSSCSASLTLASTTDFAAVGAYRSRTQTFIVQNSGSTPCLLRGARMTPDSDPEFRVDGPTRPVDIGPRRRAFVRVAFEPTETLGNRRGTLTFDVSSSDDPFPTLAVQAEAIRATPLLIGPDDIEFVVPAAGCLPQTSSLRFSNPGPTPVEVTDVLGSNDPSLSPFALTGLPALPFTIPAGSVVTADVEFDSNLINRFAGAFLVRTRLGPLTGVQGFSVTGEVEFIASVRRERFVQMGQPASDVLYVIDDSSTMLDDQVLLAADQLRYTNSARVLGVDAQWGVVSTDVGADDGELVPVDDSRPKVVTLDTEPSPTMVLGANIQLGDAGSENELALDAPRRALAGDRLVTVPATNAGFRRRSAHLGLLFMSDEPVRSLLPTSVLLDTLRSVVGVRNRNQLTISGFTGGDAGCMGGVGPYAPDPVLRQLIQATGGVEANGCSGIAPQSLIDGLYGVRSTFFLTGWPAPDTLNVFVNGSIAPQIRPDGIRIWRYDNARNAILFETIPPPGAEIDVEFAPVCPPP
jgi:hypothetical protein